LRTEDEHLLLRVPAAALPPEVTGAHFFADTWGLVEHAAEQRWRIDGDALAIELTPGATPEAVPPTGLVVIETADGGASFEVDAGAADPSLITAVGGEAEFGNPISDASAVPATVASKMGLPLALVFALLGGLALNLMPCVFPVLAIKALGLARQGGAPARERWLHALAYAAGV